MKALLSIMATSGRWTVRSGYSSAALYNPASMIRKIFDDKAALGRAAAADAAASLRQAIAANGTARIIAATGASQFEFLGTLSADTSIDWQKVEMFHLDEYVGLPIDHRASFRRYLLERLIRKTGIPRAHLLDGEKDPRQACREVSAEIAKALIDVAFVGIGENGHLAFNDPPADFQTEEPYIVVRLDEACRRQQVGEGWFESLDKVPERALSMSIRQILKARKILCIVPDARKAPAVKACLEGRVDPMAPASILQTHPDTTIYLDLESAKLLEKRDA
jgi:glucosamine-6-phosphate deaminase